MSDPLPNPNPTSGSDALGGSPGPLIRPGPPKPPRFNRNALTIVAVVMGVFVIAAVVLVSPTRSTEPAGSTRAPEVPPTTYLDRRPRPRTDVVFGDTALTPGAGSIDTAALAAQLRGMSEAAGNSPYGQTSDVPFGAYGDGGRPVIIASTGAPARHTPTAAERRRAAYEAALDAPLVGAPGAAAARVLTDAAWAGQGSAGLGAASGGVGYGLAVPEALDAPPGTPGARGPRDAFLAAAARPGVHAIRTSVEPSPGPFAVQAGTVVPAVLLTEINSDLPGECLAQITRDVYDTPTQRSILIPKGAKLLCRYDDRVNAGQSRMLIAWTRVLLPDGRSIILPGLPGADDRGARGVGGEVNRHTRQVFGTAGLLSLVGAGLQLSQPRQGGAFSAPSPGQIAAGAVGQELAQVATQLLQRDLNVQPTIRVRGTTYGPGKVRSTLRKTFTDVPCG